jgi:hypothetical protein
MIRLQLLYNSCITLIILGFDSYTTSSQQLHNNPSHEGDPSVWSPSSCEGLLCSCCISVVNLTFFNNFCLKLTIGYVWSTCRKRDPIVSLEKKMGLHTLIIDISLVDWVRKKLCPISLGQ